MVGLVSSRAALQAEILVLRHQPNVLRRKSSKRVAFSNIDRLLFVGLYRLPQSAGGAENPQAGDGLALASHRFPGVLALEVTVVLRPTKNARGHSPAHSRHERCQLPVGSATDSRRTAQARD
jgi:hypothetical protein